MMREALPSEPMPRPTIAIVGNVQTPYRIQVHRRFAREIPEVQLWSLFTHDVPDAPWRLAEDPEIRPVMFGRGESVENRAKIRYALHEWRKGGRICRWLEEHNVRFVVAGGYADPAQLRVVRWCRSRGIPCFMWSDSNIRGDLARGVRRLVKNMVVRWAVRAATGCMPFGSLGREYFLKYGAKPERVFLVPFEPDYDLIETLDEGYIKATAARLGLAPDRRRIVFTGRLVRVKRVDLAIDAFCAIAAERPEWDLVIVGTGELREQLAARVPEGLRGRVIWTGFLGDQRDVSAVYRSSDVLVLPSDYEPWALVVNEAVCAGLVVVATDVVGAAAELVEDGVSGRLFPPGDLGALTRCLREVTEADRLAEMKEATKGVLARWRREGDPVAGLRKALRVAGVLHAGEGVGSGSGAEGGDGIGR